MNPQRRVDNMRSVKSSNESPRGGLLSLLFTDIVGSSQLKETLGDREGTALIQRHHGLVRELLHQFPEGQEIETAGDSFLIVFVKPSEAVRFALTLQSRLRVLAQEATNSIQDRIGIHIGEVIIEEAEHSPRPKHLFGAQVDVCHRVMSLASGSQILLTRAAFDNARQALRGEELHGLNELQWLNHGTYLLKGQEDPVEICEVGEAGMSPLKAPSGTEKAHRHVSKENEQILGWRPAIGQVVPHTRWALEEKLGEGGFGEVWLGRHQATKERRVFKFCFNVERVRFLKRELTIFRLIKDRIGDHANIAKLHDIKLDEPPYYVELDYVEGKDLKSWCAKQGCATSLTLETRLEIVAQAAEGLQAAHDAGVIHRDVKPANILVSQLSTLHSQLRVKLTDFGIGQVVSEEYLAGITRAGFTQTILSESSSSHTGTQLYMAPELLAGKPASTRSDIYSLGVVLYQLLVGNFSQPVTTDWMDDIADPLLRSDLKHCLTGHPQDRFAGAGQLAKNLRALPQRRAELVLREAEMAARERAAHRRGVMRTAAVAFFIVVGVGYLAQYAFEQSRLARAAARRAEQKELAARQNLYAADMNLAQQAFAENNVGRAVELLQKHRPEHPDDLDLRGWEWRYLWRQCRSDELETLARYPNIVDSITFAPDGRSMAFAGYDKVIKVWDTTGRREKASWTAHQGRITALAYSRNGEILASASADSTVKLWQSESLTELRTLTHTNSVTTLGFSPDGRILATLSVGQLRLFDTTDWRLVAELPGPARFPLTASLAFSADSRSVAVPLPDGRIEVWDVTQLTSRSLVGGHSGAVYAVAFSADGRFLASGGTDSQVTLWDVKGGRRVTNHLAHSAWVSTVLFSPDHQHLITASADQTIKFWEIKTWQEAATLRGNHQEVWALALAPDGRTFASGSKDGLVKLWSTIPKRKEAISVKLPSNGTLSRLSADATVLGMADTNGYLALIDTRTMAETRRLRVVSSDATSLDITPVGHLAAIGDRLGNILIWDISKNQSIATLSRHSNSVFYVSFSINGNLLASWSSEVARVWSLESLPDIQELPLPMQGFGSYIPTFSPDGKRLATVNSAHQICVWDLSSARLLATLSGHRLSVSGIVFWPDGKRLASSSIEGTVKIWDIEKEREIATLRGQLLGFHGLTLAPDGKRLAARAGEGHIKMWDPDTRHEVATLKGFLSGPFGAQLRFLPEANTLVIFGGSELVVLRAATPEEVHAAEKPARETTNLRTISR